jgi:tetratricopeptide (TPR) repeat protein
MGSKFRYVVIALLFIAFTVAGQNKADFQSVDSLTYKYYLSGDWDKLIIEGIKAVDSNIDYKYLRQRIGYAYYSKGNYNQAKKHFEKALTYDSFNDFTLTYLYYSYLFLGQDEYASLISAKMSDELRKQLNVKLIKPIESVDLEYNYKYVTSSLRSDPQYFHIGINSTLGPRFSLYQMFGHYNQTYRVRQLGGYSKISDTQPEYYALLKFAASQHFIISTAYHYLYPTYDQVTSPIHLSMIEISSDKGRFNFGLNASVLNTSSYTVKQAGIRTVISFTKNVHMYFGSSLSMTFKRNEDHMIFTQTAGFKVYRNLWIEGNVTIGNFTDYHDHEAMYVYDFIDPTTFRSGLTGLLYTGKHLSLWTNVSFEQKEYYSNTNYHYSQFSYLGGIKWKL